MLVLNLFNSLDFGGVESHALSLADGNSQQGLKHQFVALSFGGHVSERLTGRGEAVHLLNCNVSIPSFQTIFELYRLIKEIKPDVVHTRGAESCFHGVIAAKLAGVKIVVAEEIGIPTHSNLAKIVFKQLYRLTDKLVAISKSVKQWIIDNHEAPSDKIRVVYNPSKFFPLRTQPKNNASFSIGFVGRLEEVKNPTALVEAIKLLNDAAVNITLHLVGDGSQRNDIESYIATHGLKNNVHVHGFCENPHEYIKNCDLYVQPSITEGFGIAVVEVMGSGIPVLASPVGGIPEFITHNKNGYLLDGVDSKSISDSIFKLIELGKKELAEVGVKGRESVINRFTIDSYLVNLHSLYVELLKKKK
ncbi:glycosyltransferase [Vibrio splendidus]|uniref:glycosyltransferase n=1 Tax=Vibrio splendidus TaxID=29497 RepID=UPI001FB4A107|nr:glycosyltransferase [Vibrio splendidus]UOE80915.1 glycosyltransferase [Vibrio splendidus]